MMTTNTVPEEPKTLTVAALKEMVDMHLSELKKSGPIYDDWLVVQGDDGGYYGIQRKALYYDIPFTYKPTFDD